ncbi:MAG: M23 family metallopeptidase, partial [Flavobacteriales bacterium]|nr:M23 family metallopeptidase [Flavobacteriales bacterium]
MEIRFLYNSNNVVINFLRRAKYSVWLLFVAVSLCALDIHAQNTDYISPLDIPLDFAGNFGELRSGHFHMGLDMRTQGREEHVVKSIADGYVSRISINTKGYGQALYINHPDGNTSVYAHLSDFSGSIKDWTRKVQYAKKTYTLDTLLPEGLLPVSGGQQIGSSGNSGGSSGPHLHFEIRNTKTERAINPMYFGFKPVRDNTPPELLLLAIYPLNEVSFVNGKQQPAYLPLKKKDGKYQLETTPAVYGKIGFGIYCRDRIDGSSFSFAVHSVQLLKKNVVVYAHRIDSIAFNHSRFVNAHIDYPEAIRSKRKIQKSYLSDFNELDIYAGVVNGGKFFFTGDTSTPMRYEV